MLHCYRVAYPRNNKRTPQNPKTDAATGGDLSLAALEDLGCVVTHREQLGSLQTAVSTNTSPESLLGEGYKRWVWGSSCSYLCCLLQRFLGFESIALVDGWSMTLLVQGSEEQRPADDTPLLMELAASCFGSNFPSWRAWRVTLFTAGSCASLLQGTRKHLITRV